jgi:hypothetical protein
MSTHEPRVSGTIENGFYALIVRIDRDGEENVINGFARHYKTRKAGERAAAKYIAKMEALRNS